MARQRRDCRDFGDVNERGGLGDDVPPNYFTAVRDRGFYGFPYAYVGTHVDGRVRTRRTDSAVTVVVPDLLLGAHDAPIQFVFYEARQFPRAYWHDAFIAEHGSSNRSRKTGYDVVFVPFREGNDGEKQGDSR
jgi:glucose/arabinose dehydrogenase